MKTAKPDIPPSEPDNQETGQFIGPYKLLERLGEGGWGAVYVAEQQTPLRRRVALKVIKLGKDTRQVVARFETERRALAMMDHPNIAAVLDAGATESGRPYFVMELVRGIKITEYCDLNKLSTEERLHLFVTVCHAVQHAHQKGIIHRDLKPSNILITLHDGVPVPKVIDFGIAKATEGRLTDATVYTRLNQFIGTPAYMSPEQAEMSALDVDTRSDIYSLGVILYELLTGRTPFDPKELTDHGVDAMRRFIREKDPPPPSTRLSTLAGAELSLTAARQSVEPPRLLHLIKGDLDWVVMKCLEKDRNRRYETANSLAADVDRHLVDEPILACPPSAFYRFQKLVRRNRMAFGTGAAVAVVLVLGTVISSLYALEAMRAHAAAVKKAEEEAKLKNHFEAIADLIRAKDFFSEGYYQAADDLVRDLPDDIVKEEFVTVGTLFRGLSHWHAGEQRWRESASYLDRMLYGPASSSFDRFFKAAEINPEADILSLTPNAGRFIYFERAVLTLEMGDREGYERVRREAIAKLSGGVEDFDPEASIAILAICLLAPLDDVDRVLLSRCAATLNLYWDSNDGGDPELKYAVNALFTFRRGEPEWALRWVRQCLGREPKSQQIALAKSVRSMACWELGRDDLAREELAWCRNRIDAVFSDEFEAGKIANVDWADWLLVRLLVREAEQLMATTPSGRALAGSIPRKPDDSLTDPTWEEAMDKAYEDLARALKNWGDGIVVTRAAWLFDDAGKFELEELAHRRVLEINQEAHGRDSLEAVIAMQQLSFGLSRVGKFDEAEQLARKALAFQERTHYRESGHFEALFRLTHALLFQGNFAEAETLGREALDVNAGIRQGTPDVKPPFWLYRNLGVALYKEGRYQEAEGMLRKAVASRSGEEDIYAQRRLLRKHGPGLHDNLFTAPVYYLAEALVAQGLSEQAAEVCRAELTRREHLPNRYTWDGRPRPQETAVRFRLSQLQPVPGGEADSEKLLDDLVQPGDPISLTKSAWSLATSAEPARRDGPAAVRLAEKAVAVTGRTNATVWYGKDPFSDLAPWGYLPLETLAAAYAEAGDFARAIRTQRDALAVLAPCNDLAREEFEARIKLYEAKRPYHDVNALEAKARRLLAKGEFDEAEAAASECLAIRRIMRPDDWRTFDAMSLLGAVSLGQGKHEKAKALLHAGYDGLMALRNRIPAHAAVRSGEAAERLVRLYEALGQPGEAARWRQILSE